MIAALVVVAIIVLLLVWGVVIYNGLVRLRALVKEGFSGITVQLRRRADLVPNLVSTVEGYATHEREVLTQVTAHRGEAIQAGSVAATAQADAAFTGMLGRLMAVAEAYPDLKANTNFLQLQSELSDIENKLASARRFFNSAVAEFNAVRQQFPTVLFAGMFGFGSDKPFFDVGAADRATMAAAPPQVKF
jgi:LemA protein